MLTAWAAVSTSYTRTRKTLAHALRRVWLACCFAGLRRAASSRRLLRAALRAWQYRAKMLIRLACAGRAVAAVARRGLLGRAVAAWRARCALARVGRAVAAQRLRRMLAAALHAMRSHAAARRAKRALAERAHSFRLQRILHALWWCAPANVVQRERKWSADAPLNL